MSSPTWMSEQEPNLPKILPIDFLRLLIRFIFLGAYTFSGLALLLLFYALEVFSGEGVASRRTLRSARGLHG